MLHAPLGSLRENIQSSPDSLESPFKVEMQSFEGAAKEPGKIYIGPAACSACATSGAHGGSSMGLGARRQDALGVEEARHAFHKATGLTACPVQVKQFAIGEDEAGSVGIIPRQSTCWGIEEKQLRMACRSRRSGKYARK